jgi:hypothetical protein
MEPALMVTVNLSRKAGVRSEPATAATPLLLNATGVAPICGGDGSQAGGKRRQIRLLPILA